MLRTASLLLLTSLPLLSGCATQLEVDGTYGAVWQAVAGAMEDVGFRPHRGDEPWATGYDETHGTMVARRAGEGPVPEFVEVTVSPCEPDGPRPHAVRIAAWKRGWFGLGRVPEINAQADVAVAIEAQVHATEGLRMGD